MTLGYLLILCVCLQDSELWSDPRLYYRVSLQIQEQRVASLCHADILKVLNKYDLHAAEEVMKVD